jgi:hypothetical protein
MPDLSFWIPFIALGVAIYGVLLQRRQTHLMIEQSAEHKKLAMPEWWRSPTIGALVVLAALTWVPWLAMLATPKPKPVPIAIAGWGGINLEQKTLPVAAVVGETNPNIRLMAIAFHYNGETDFTDVKELQKSALYDTRLGSVVLMIKADDNFINEVVAKKQVGTNFMLLTVPAKLENIQFSTIRQALSMGAQIVGSGTGPP